MPFSMGKEPLPAAGCLSLVFCVPETLSCCSREELSIYLDWLFFLYLGAEVVQVSGKLSLVGWVKPVLYAEEGEA